MTGTLTAISLQADSIRHEFSTKAGSAVDDHAMGTRRKVRRAKAHTALEHFNAADRSPTAGA